MIKLRDDSWEEFCNSLHYLIDDLDALEFELDYKEDYDELHEPFFKIKDNYSLVKILKKKDSKSIFKTIKENYIDNMKRIKENKEYYGRSIESEYEKEYLENYNTYNDILTCVKKMKKSKNSKKKI